MFDYHLYLFIFVFAPIIYICLSFIFVSGIKSLAIARYLGRVQEALF